jgi:hypothetical protein
VQPSLIPRWAEDGGGNHPRTVANYSRKYEKYVKKDKVISADGRQRHRRIGRARHPAQTAGEDVFVNAAVPQTHHVVLALDASDAERRQTQSSNEERL